MSVPLPQLKPIPAATDPPDNSMTPSGTWAKVGYPWPSNSPMPVAITVKSLRMLLVLFLIHGRRGHYASHQARLPLGMVCRGGLPQHRSARMLICISPDDLLIWTFSA